MAANDGEHPVTSLFGQALPSGTGAPGSGGTTEADTQPDSAFHATVTMPYMSVQNVSPPMVGVGTDDTNLPNQNVSYGPDRDPLTGIGPELGTTGSGLGSNVMQGHHPNSTARP